jgi:ATP-dependent Lon protease
LPSSPYRLEPQALRWRCAAEALSFASTSEVDPAEGVVGQPVAIEALRFGLQIAAPNQNIYVRGLSGTGRMAMVQSVLAELKPAARRRLDRCYVHNFSQADRPRLVTLPAGEGPCFKREMRQAADFIETRLGEVFTGEAARLRRAAIEKDTEQAVNAVTKPLEKTLRANGLTMVQVQAGEVSRPAIFLMHDGQAVPPEQFKDLVIAGELSEEQAAGLEAKIRTYSVELEGAARAASAALREGMGKMRAFIEEEVRQVLEQLFAPLLARFDTPAVRTFISEVSADVLDNRLPGSAADNLPSAAEIYGVNVVSSFADGAQSPVVTENTPTATNLLGSVEPDFVSGGQVVSNYRGVRAGALVRADGGYLVLDAHDLLTEPGAWRILMRALRTGSVEIAAADNRSQLAPQSLKPEPIDIEVRVILLGSHGLYYQLDRHDQDFSDLFKVLADFDSEIERSAQGIAQYAGVVARLCTDENLLHFSADGVAALAEHGARIASRTGKLTARFGRLADIAREAAFVAGQQQAEQVQREHVEETVRRTRYRASLPSSRFQGLVADGVIQLQTRGTVAGQINGLAVIQAGPLSYGFPARLTATVGAGRAGVIDIEGAASLSGSIHTKGFHILGGLLRFILRTDHSLAFSASIAFEQSYGGIDGDSASGAEFCCLLSAMTEVPINQGLAMTGAIDQHGHLQAIGGVNEKIDGFFDACQSQGLSGEQGVIIPRSNAGDLMLRQDVVEACAAGQFHVYAVSTVGEALEVLTGMPAGNPQSSAPYAEGSLYALAQQRAAEFLRRSINQQPGSRNGNGGNNTGPQPAAPNPGGEHGAL